MKVIGQAHGMLHDKGIVRIQTDIRVGSRYDPSIKFVLCGFFRLSRQEAGVPGFLIDILQSNSMYCKCPDCSNIDKWYRIDKEQSFHDKVAAVDRLLAADK